MKTLLKYVKPERWLITLALFVKGLGALSELVIPYILSKMIDDIAPTENVALIALWGGVMLACALGALGEGEIAISTLTARRGDSYLLLSDGLYGTVDDAVIRSLLAQQLAPSSTVGYLIATANENGGEDNITAALVRV